MAVKLDSGKMYSHVDLLQVIGENHRENLKPFPPFIAL
jgi:hypothetical protein